MTPELEALARRAVACPRWRWMGGMLTNLEARVMHVHGVTGLTLLDALAVYVVDEVDSDETPDLTDPATLGCLLALVREAWGQPSATTLVHRGRWYVVYEDVDASSWLAACLPTEIEALIAALEAAP